MNSMKGPRLLPRRFSNVSGGYQGPYNPWLDHIHRLGANSLKLLAVSSQMQRDTARVYRDVGKMYGQPKMVLRFQTYYAKIADANVALMEQLARDYVKPTFDLHFTEIDGHKVEVTEEVVDTMPFCKLTHFVRDVDRNDPIILLIAPQSGHYATLLRPTVERLLPEAEVYITDWTNARDVPMEAGEFNLDTYADYLIKYMELLGPETNVFAICQSTVPAVMAVSRLAEDNPGACIATLTLMAGPLDPDAGPTQVTKFANKMHLPSYLLTYVTEAPNGRMVYPGYVQLMGFIAMNPKNHFSSHRDLYNHYITDDTHPGKERIERFYREYFAVADLTAEFYADTVKRAFLKKQLANGTMMYNGRLVRPELITCPIIGIEGAMDDISGPGQTREFLKKFTASNDITFYEQARAGHYGVFAGGHWRRDIAPRIVGKIHETAKVRGIEYTKPQNETVAIEPFRPEDWPTPERNGKTKLRRPDLGWVKDLVGRHAP